VEEQFFPNLEKVTDQELYYKGLAALYPKRVLFEDPQLSPLNDYHSATQVEDLPRQTTYIRIYRLNEAKIVLESHLADAALIIDLRYLRSNLAAVDIFSLLTLENTRLSLKSRGNIPMGLLESPNKAEAKRTAPIIVLVNRETAGPFEAALAELQLSGSIIGIGEPTAGRTGFYQEDPVGIWTVNGEITASNGESLIGKGFTPRIQIEIDPTENYLSYNLYEAGTPIEKLLREGIETVTATSDKPSKNESAHTDRVLQRGLDTVAALQILQ